MATWCSAPSSARATPLAACSATFPAPSRSPGSVALATFAWTLQRSLWSTLLALILVITRCWVVWQQSCAPPPPPPSAGASAHGLLLSLVHHRPHANPLCSALQAWQHHPA